MYVENELKDRAGLIFMITLFLLLFVLGAIAGKERPESRTTPSSSAGNIANHLVISEIYYKADDNYDSEFIEFYNPTDEVINLSGWEFSDDGGQTWVGMEEDTEEQETLKVPAGGFLLLVDGEWGSDRDQSDWPPGDVVDEISLSDGGDTVKIRDAGDSVVDAVNYAGEVDRGKSVERKAEESSTASSMRGSDAEKGNGYDTDNFSEDFVGPLPGEPQNRNSEPEKYGTTENQPPVADPGGPYHCEEGGSVQLDGSDSSDPDGTISSYEWDLDGDGTYDEADGIKVTFTPDSSGEKSVGLKVTDDKGATDSAETTVSVGAELKLSVSDINLPADGTTTTKVTARYLEGSELRFESQSGQLSSSSVTVGSDGKATVNITAPKNPGASVIKVSGGNKVAVTTVYFLEEDRVPVKTVRTGLISSGVESGSVGGKTEIGALLTGEKAGGSLEEEVTLSLGQYENSPAGEDPLCGKATTYLNLSADKPSALEGASLKVYLDPWPENPGVKFLSSSEGKWLNASQVDKYPGENYLEVIISSETKPSLADLSNLPLVVGNKSTDEPDEPAEREIELTEPGWNLVSLPLIPQQKSPTEVFSGLGPKKIQQWKRQGSDGQAGYVTAGSGVEVGPCRGNWVYVTDDQVPKTFNFKGEASEEKEIILKEKGWYQIGFPKGTGLQKLGARKGQNGKVVSLEEAASSGWLWRFLWAWDGAEKSYYAYEFGVNQKSLEAGTGYWIKTREPDIRLIFSYTSPPSPPSSAGAKTEEGIPLSNRKRAGAEIPTPPRPPELFSSDELSLTVFPNPVLQGDEVSFRILGPNVKSFQVMVYGGTGKEIFSSGFQMDSTVKWKLTAGEGARVPNGIYISEVKVKKDSGEVIRKAAQILLVR